MARGNQIYSIGLDIGTSSVGWSVVNQDYQMLKYKGKNMWGVRMFEEGKTAADRRMERTTRRRYARRRQRIALLKSLVGDIVLDKDPNFFMRLEKGYLTVEDKGYPYNIFSEYGFSDKEYYTKFPTIYHLRKYVCEAKEQVDPRLIYLALHHIIKYRGNFLYEGKFSLGNETRVLDDYQHALESLFSANGYACNLSQEEVQASICFLMRSDLNKKDKKEQVFNVLAKNDKDLKKFINEMVDVLLGKDCNVSHLLGRELQRDQSNLKINFSSDKYEEDEEYLSIALEEDYELLVELHNVYSFLSLQSIMNGSETIYEAMIKRYDTHHNDLENLKQCIKKYYGKKEYDAFFRDDSRKGNYVQYINHPKDTSKVELYAYVKSLLLKNEEARGSCLGRLILDRIEMDIFLPKQTSKENGEIPHQLHEVELHKILDGQGEYYPNLKENKDKICSLFRFRVPYYVGPLNENSEFSWIQKKSQGTIYPWNFDEKVDRLGSAEAFIRNMTNCCTYLLSEPVIPKHSLVYTKFEVLNELNRIRVKGKLLEPSIKIDIIDTVFLKHKKVKTKDIWDYCVAHQLVNQEDEMEVQGCQKETEFASSMESWIDFMKIYGHDFESHKGEIEKIIEWITVYEDKKILKLRLEKEFPNMTSSCLYQILKKRYSGWGRFSNKLLCEMKVQNQYGDSYSIMDCLENTKKNFMQIINDKKLGFKERLEAENFTSYDKITLTQIAQLQGSPAIKKGIWQTMKIVEEIVQIMKHQPKHLFIEFARSDDEKVRSVSKVKRLQNIYRSMEKDGYKSAMFCESYKNLKCKDENATLMDERLYLYFIQHGKCMYSGKALDIDQLSRYQIDHVIPQSYIKDDSIDNKVLVFADENQYKGDRLLLKPDVINQQFAWWKKLRDYQLISDKKFKNLIRTTLTENEEIGFINRQLVETRQIIKHVANLFENVYENTSVVSIKADLSHNFREKHGLYKIREINDYHHAQDAYLACLIGTFVLKRYPVLQKEFLFTEYNQIQQYRKDLSKMKTNKGFGFIINQMHDQVIYNNETKELVWGGRDTLNLVCKAFNFKDCFITKKVEERKGQLFNITISKAKDLNKDKLHKVIPVNKNRKDVIKYGGFTSLQYAYGIAVEYEDNGKLRRRVIDFPRFLTGASQDEINAYLKSETKSEVIKIIKEKILFNQLIEVDGNLFTMGSASEFNNARQLLLSKKSISILHAVFHSTKEVMIDDYLYVYDEYVEKLETHYPVYKGLAVKIKKLRESFIRTDDKRRVLIELLKITKASPAIANLNIDSYKLSSSAGRLNNKVIDLNKTYFINQSVTGMYSKKYKL